MQKQNLAMMEATLANKAWTFYEQILHLDTSMEELGQEWEKICQTRIAILQAYGVSVSPAAQSMGKMGVTAPVKGKVGEVSWKSALNEELTKKFKRTLTKDELVYQTTEADGGYMTSLSGPGLLEADYASEKVCVSKKLSEASAAKMAVQAEYMATFKKLSMQEQTTVATKPVAGQKRKAEDAVPVDPKSKLNESCMLLLERACTRTDIVYTVSEQGGKCTATVTVPAYNSQVFTSPPSENKKAAENSAAEKALKAWASTLKPLQEAHQAKKEAAKKKKLAELAEKTKADKEAKKLLTKA